MIQGKYSMERVLVNNVIIFSEVIKDLKSTGKIIIPDAAECERLLNQNLKCHRCDTTLANMPKLKEHILTHN